MANVKATMTDIKVIIREFYSGTSLREIERKLKLSRTSLRNYRSRAEATGMSMQELLNLSDVELQSIIQKGDGHRIRDTLPYNFMQEYIEGYALQYPFGCSSLYSSHNILRVRCLLLNFSMKCGRSFKIHPFFHQVSRITWM